MLDTRQAAVSGRFYPSDPHVLSGAVRQYMTAAAPPEAAVAVVAPHAGYVFSGAIAGATYAGVSIPERVVVICPNHTGRGVPRSLWSGGAWQLPGGAVPIDERLRQEIGALAALEPDRRAHEREHAIEVHLPFLRERQPALSIVPIVLGPIDYRQCREIGMGLAEALRRSAARSEPALIVASTDMSHYITAAEAERLDRMALDRAEALDPEGLYRVVRSERISMCGVIPVAVALVAALELGATRCRLVRYGNSGEVSGDFESVVGYAGMVVS